MHAYQCQAVHIALKYAIADLPISHGTLVYTG